MKIRTIATMAFIVLAGFSARLEAAVSGSILPSAGRIAIACLIVAMLIYATVLMLKKLVLKGNGRRAECINVVGSYPLGQRTRLCMVEVAGRVILLGITPQNVSSLAEFDPSEIPVAKEPSKVGSFVRHLQSFSFSGIGAKGSSTG